MNEELEQQDAVITRVTDHVGRTELGLTDVQRSAEQTLGKKGAACCLFKLVVVHLQLLRVSERGTAWRAPIWEAPTTATMCRLCGHRR